ncbi:MurR/RpiR family transcriptional regulator [Enterocloster bolteae]|uniref:MurR/RpiR family transcriptional regulator n=1 Tax=Enterocloster bolteae TaxID=208479 RepID=UPI0028DCFC04|nr:MurR/RpiR family transcriptional regulator [Enterocloster bolteae]
MFLFQKIEETMMKYTDARHAVGEFILQEPENLYQYTITEIAAKTFTSKATVVRFAKAMGYDGWKEFMKDYIAEVKYQKDHKNTLDFNMPFQKDDSVDTIIENIKKLQIESISETADLLKKEVLQKATDYLVRANQIEIFCSSPNTYAGELFKRKLITIGKRANVAVSGEAGIVAASLGPQDCALIISYSGNSVSRNPVNRIGILKKNHVPIIGITSGGDNYMRKNLDCIFTMCTRERLYTKIANYSTEESLNYLLNVLFSCCFARQYEQNLDFKIKNSRLLEQERLTMINELKEMNTDD